MGGWWFKKPNRSERYDEHDEHDRYDERPGAPHGTEAGREAVALFRVFRLHLKIGKMERIEC